MEERNWDWDRFPMQATAAAAEGAAAAAVSPGARADAPDPADDGGDTVLDAAAAADRDARSDALRMVVREHIGGTGTMESQTNLCVLVGTVRRERYGPKQKARAADISPLGMRIFPYRIDVEEPGGTAYSMPVSVSPRMMETGLWNDGMRVMLSGSIRLEQTFDRSLAVGPDDVGPPVWEVRMHVLSIGRAPADVVDGSWVRIVGTVDAVGGISREAVGPGVIREMGVVRIRSTTPLQRVVATAQGRHTITSVVRVDVPLDGTVAQAEALLKGDNRVMIEGRLVPRIYQRRRSDPRVQQVLRSGIEALRAETGAQGAREGRIAAFSRRVLIGVRMTIEVTAVTLLEGHMPTERDLERLRSGAGGGGGAGRPRPPATPPSPALIGQALDQATLALLTGAPPESSGGGA